MRYLPLTDADRKEMLASLGMESVEELFSDIPPEVRSPALQITSLSEPELEKHIKELGEKNRDLAELQSFLGGGIYQHFIPHAVDHLSGRVEFYTAYTPYQAEVSQGTLQAIFEYQTLVSLLTGMEVANASMYDGASAVAEAALMARSITGRKALAYSAALHPQYQRVLRTYTQHLGLDLVELPWTEKGQTDLDALPEKDFSALILQNPNYFGVLEPVAEASRVIHERGGLFIYSFSEAVSLGLLPPPGSLGADIVAGEGQSLGIPPSFGGPGLGIFATREQFMRRMPGRIIGEARDAEGKRAFVMVLQTREQHIRREKATSNICSNQALCALRALIYLSLMGEKGFRAVAEQCYHKAHYLSQALEEIPGVKLRFRGEFFNEFVLTLPQEPEGFLNFLLKNSILGGIPLKKYYPSLKQEVLVTVTEVHPKENLDKLVHLLKEWRGGLK
ncbi:MAG: aminomethyl-transferring glycine dehydrogenase subunit GcvPA [Caldiserica bacterium]|jgi:glycine dehydrogenase subunit 1|nr:aminomethyl-transferring glycine dehydrogenase subunit GcvPA [Caldisericota bacterium]